jgi:DeoR family transcriptional regulator, fructose operon transcriptional repressor
MQTDIHLGGNRLVFAEERRQDIVRRARQMGCVDVATLAVELDVTPEMIRRDLTVLERAEGSRPIRPGAAGRRR